MSGTVDIPKGFSPYPADGSFNDAFGPVYIWHQEGEMPRFALHVEKHHLNPMGICHGTVYMFLFDMAFPSAIGHALGKYTGTPTMNININFARLARQGDWIFTEAFCDRTAKTAAFVHGSLVNGEGDVLATATGLFKLPDNLEKTTGFTR